MTTTPWNSIAESVPPPRGANHLPLVAARESPCATCSTSPCCTHLPLTTFQVTNLVELDHAIYLLNFDRIELGLSPAGEWSAYYAFPCRFLDRETAACTVHNTPDQPQICVHYNPYNCWYKRAFNSTDSDEFVRIDRSRLELLMDEIVFDEERRIVSVPDWDDLVALMAGHDDQPGEAHAEPPLTDPMIEAWQAAARQPSAAEETVVAHAFDDFPDPCNGCDAYCCSTLVFPQTVPTHVSNFDFLRFSLGFPGVELAVGEGSWSIVVKTTCRHLDGGQCSVYGQAERPLICKYYDAAKCDYKPQFGVPRPEHSMRIRLEQYAALTAQLAFDDAGNLLGLPPFEQLRAGVEGTWARPTHLPVISTARSSG